MKYRIILFITVIALLSLVINGCKDDSNPTTPPTQTEANKITFNGGGYSNITASSVFTYAAYLQTINQTGIEFHCIINTDTLYMIIYTPGQSNGTFLWQTANNYAFLWIRPAGTIYRNYINSGTTEITVYGSTGQKIEGNFSGNVIETISPYDTISVSCNKFSVTRSME